MSRSARAVFKWLHLLFNSSHDWLMNLAMDLAALCGGKNDTNGCHLAVFSEDIPPICGYSPGHRSPSGIGYTSKRLSKMMGNSACYPVNM